MNHRKPKLGQHFLADQEIVDQIITLAALPTNATVVEIGPGLGVLTRALNAAVPDGQVLAIEVDGTLARQVAERVSKRVKIIHQDALRFDYASVAAPYHVVSNLPYQITSPIVHTLISSTNPPETMTLMMQREVAERLTAAPKTRERGLLTIVCEWYGTIEYGFDVPPSAFTPPPAVQSAVVKLSRTQADRPAFGPFLHFLKVGFSQKRRQIHHPLNARFPMLAANLDAILAKADVQRTQRAEELTFDQWVRLYEQVRRLLSDEVTK